MKRLQPTTILFLAATLVAGGCERSPRSIATQPSAISAPSHLPEDRLDLIAPPAYGLHAPAQASPDWAASFAQKTGCKVDIQVAASEQQLLQMVNRGQFDLVVAPAETALRLAAAGKVQALEVSRVPSFHGIDRRIRARAWDSEGLVRYGVPFQWGPNFLLYDTRAFESPPGDWSVLFEPRELGGDQDNAGRVQARASPISIADGAVYLMSSQPGLGIDDPFVLDERQYASALEVLRRQKPLVHRYWRHLDEQFGDLSRGGVVAAASRGSQLAALQAASLPFAGLVPSGGATAWADTQMMSSSARHPNCAYLWLEWSLAPEMQADLAVRAGAVPVVPAACASGMRVRPAACDTDGFDALDRLHFPRTPGLACDGRECVPYSRWTKDYLELVGD